MAAGEALDLSSLLGSTSLAPLLPPRKRCQWPMGTQGRRLLGAPDEENAWELSSTSALTGCSNRP